MENQYSNEESFLHYDICYKFVPVKKSFKNYIDYCLINEMVPVMIKNNQTFNEIKKYFSR